MPNTEYGDREKEWRIALVVFGGETALPLLRLLKPGFRHCFLLYRLPPGWLLYDPRSDLTELALWPDCGAAELEKSLVDKGYSVVHLRYRPVLRRAAPLGPFTCVEAVKRALGLRARWILTPWQLYRRLNRTQS